MALHGYEDDPDMLSTQLRTLDPTRRFGIVAPTGPVRAAQGPAWFASNPDDDGPPLIDTLTRIRALVAEHAARATVDDVVVVGYSQGAATALALAFGGPAAPQPAEVIGLAAWLPDEPGLSWDFTRAGTAGRVLLAHGSDDDVVPVGQGRSAHRVLERHGVDVTWLEIDTGHELPALVRAIQVWLTGP